MLIGAYYYAWYRDSWLSKTKRVDCPPLLGEYDNTVYSDVILQQFQQAKDHGIDFLSVSWEHTQDHWHLFEAASKVGIKLTFFYESLTRVGKKGDLSESELSSILDDVNLISEYFEHPSWLKINNKPVIMFYVTRAFRGDLHSIFADIRCGFSQPVFLVGDHLFWKEMKNEGALINFDAVTYYNMYQKGKFQGASDEEVCNSYLSTSKAMLTLHAEACKRFNTPIWGTAMPGYNDLGVRPDREHPIVPRMDGEFFRKSLKDAKEMATGKVVMITSYNEWYEDTQIEPCTEYGTKYLEILKDFKEKL